MADDKQQPIEMTPENTWCARHLEPFRAQWPKGYLLAMPLMFSAFSMLDDVMAYCDPNDGSGMSDTRRLQAALAEFGPICCRLDPLLLAEIVEGSLSDDPDAWRAVKARIDRELGIA